MTNSQNQHFAIFSANYHPNIGGVERFTEGIAHALEDMGHKVTIVTSNVFNLPSHECISKGIDIYRLPCHPLLSGRLPVPRSNKEYKSLIADIASMKYDGILINTRFYPHSLQALAISRSLNITPLVLDHGSAYLTLGNPIIDVAVRIYEHAVTSMGKLICRADYYGISERSCKWLKRFGIESNGVICNSIDADNYRYQASERNFKKECAIPSSHLIACYIGRLIPEKGIDNLIASMRLIADKPISLLVAGDGPLREIVCNAGIRNCHYLGRLNAKDIASLLTQSDVMCLPSRSEGFATSLLEASACKTPSITSDVGGARELIPDSSYGIILKDVKPATIANALIFAQDNKACLGAAGEKSFELVKTNYSWESAATTLLQAFERANPS